MGHVTLMTFFAVTQGLFAFAFGACTGSLINVLVYRMPRGMSVVTPASRCPSCDRVLTWRENIPVLGWLMLRGRCRFCKARISPEYPIVEAIVGGLFLAFYVLWYLVPARGGVFLGVDWSTVRPEWALNGFGETWPIFVAWMVLVGSLVAMTIIDARTFTIPLVLTWVPAVVALLAHGGLAAFLDIRGDRLRATAPDEWWAMSTPGPHGWGPLGLAIGATAGLVLSNALLAAGLLKRSFDDYEAWESEALKEAGIAETPAPEGPAAPETSDPSADSGDARRRRRLVAAMVLLGAGVGAAALGMAGRPALIGVVPGVLLAIPLAGLLIRRLGWVDARRDSDGESPAELWIQYPHARREVIREAVFLAPCIALAITGWVVAHRVGGPWTLDRIDLSLVPARSIPLWLSVLGGVLLGYVVGGGLIWGIRILGTVAFGKEAMGLGDVHLLAAVGACVGWIDSVLAFFVAPFLAIYIVLVQACWSGEGRRAMPYGPYLAAATLVVVLGKTPIEAGLTALFGSPVPINLP